jgi:paraquat-inducible protein B
MNEPFVEPAPAAGDPLIVRRRRWPSLVWLVPIVAALVGLSMLIHAVLSVGPDISLSFQTASGLEPGKTPVKYKDVVVGTVSGVKLSQDGSHIVATVSLDRSAENLARSDSRFWVVRPRIGAAGISGIDTLLSGAYIAVDKGTSARKSRSFTGLESPPTVTHGTPGKSFVLHAADLGSLDIGSPIYYRRIQVGRVASYRLDAGGNRVSLQIFIDSPYDGFVTTATRFWNASGVDISLGASGLKVNTQSLATVIAGGIAFAKPSGSEASMAPSQWAFDLAKDESSAMATQDGPGQHFQLRFTRPVRGLTVGAPVEFSGISIGEVTSIQLDYEPADHHFLSVVDAVMYPNRLGNVLHKLPKISGDMDQQNIRFMQGMVEHGLRAQTRSGNLLTGQLYISLDFIPHAAAVAFDANARPIILPTVAGDLDHMQEQVESIIAKIDKIPLQSIGQHLDASLSDLDKTLKQINTQTVPEATRALQQGTQTLGAVQALLNDDSPLQQNLGQTLLEVQSAARSVHGFMDLLDRHPAALLRGLPADPAPNPPRSPGKPITQSPQ